MNKLSLKRALMLVLAAISLALSAAASRADAMSRVPDAREASSDGAASGEPLGVSSVQNLTHDSAIERNPAVTVNSAGDVIVAWEQDNVVSGLKSREIYARVAPNGSAFGLSRNISNDRLSSREPSLLVASTGAYLFYLEVQLGAYNFDISDSTYNGSWSTPSVLVNSPQNSTFDPQGVQATDGSIWMLWQQGGGGSRTDALVRRLGGPTWNLSQDGSAARHPAIAAGPNGTIYVAWDDHANETPGIAPGIKVWRWNGSAWSRITPLPTMDTSANFLNMTFSNGKLYLLWRSGFSPTLVNERVWNGSTWGAKTVISSGTTPNISIPQSGNIYIAWANNGAVYLKKNSGPATRVSTGVPSATMSSLYVDSHDVAHIVFQNGTNGGDIWYVTAQ